MTTIPDPNEVRRVMRAGHGGKPCNCPREYTLCKHWVAHLQRQGRCEQHGGWGWLGAANGYQDGPASN